MRERRFWIAVASRNHVMKGVAGGFAQVCHGKCSPLQRMQARDGLIYYSPRQEFDGTEPCQAFTAIGRIVDGRVYEFDMGEGFTPFRTNVAYSDCTEAPIEPLLDLLSFIKSKKQWGFPFRTGHFEIVRSDFDVIAAAMGVRDGESYR